MEQPQQISINMEDVQVMFSERDMQILQLRSAVRLLTTELEEKNKKIKELEEKCHQNNTGLEDPQ